MPNKKPNPDASDITNAPPNGGGANTRNGDTIIAHVSEQASQVAIGKEIHQGDIVEIGNLIQLIKYPSRWPDALWQLMIHHRFLLLSLFLAEISVLFLFLRFRNSYLILLWADGWGYCTVASVLIATAVCSGYLYRQARRKPIFGSVALASIVLVGILVGSQIQQVFFQNRFPPETFGIAVAVIGEGADIRAPDEGMEISQKIFNRLCGDLRNHFVTSGLPCAASSRATNSPSVQLKQIGVVSDGNAARRWGERLGADVVIWGQLSYIDNNNVAIYFQVSETLDRTINPDFPLVRPVTTTATEIYADYLNSKDNPDEFERLIAQQSAIISSFALGLAAYLERDFPAAINYLETAAANVELVEAQAENAPRAAFLKGQSLIYFYLGKASHAMGRIEEGQQALTIAQERNPAEPAIPLSLGFGFASLGDDEKRHEHLDKAAKLLDDWLETHPDDNTARYNRGVLYGNRKEYREAILTFKEIIELEPAYYTAYLMLAHQATESDQPHKAIDYLQAALDIAENMEIDPAWAYLGLARAHEKAEQFEAARGAYQSAINQASDIDTMYYYYARFLDQQGEPDAALEAYKMLTEVSKIPSWAYGVLAAFYRSLELYPQAVDSYQQAILAQPDDELLRTYLGEIHFALGEYEQAFHQFEQAIRLPHKNYYPYVAFAYALMQVGELERAAAMYEQSLVLYPHDFSSLLNVADIYVQQGEFDRARRKFLQIVTFEEGFDAEQMQIAHNRLATLDIDMHESPE